MSDSIASSRRRFLSRAIVAVGGMFLTGCERLSETQWFPKVLGAGEKLSEAAQKLVTGRKSMAQEFSEADLSPAFRSNGTADPESDAYKALAAKAFADYKLEVAGLAAQLSVAPHFQTATPVLVRFSNFAGVPTVADNDPNFSSPKGCAVRFQLGVERARIDP